MLQHSYSYTKVYSDLQEKSIASEFQRLQGQCYLEHAGATLYSEKQIKNIQSDLINNLYANPHARSTSSKVTEDTIDQIRFEILNHFKTNIEEYSIIFTSGCTAALKIVAETFDYRNGHFTYLQDNHTSVLGMREYATSIKSIRPDEAFEIFSETNKTDVQDTTTNENSLFVYPAQCNFSGTKYPLSWIEKVQNGAFNQLNNLRSQNWFCCLDAAAFVSTNDLDLSMYKPDFVCISFYKIFGYPTGLGALLVRNCSAPILNKKYYGGGTVLMAISLENIAVRREILHERFEDGTVPFLSILALKHGFETMNRLNLTMELISQHTFGLAQYVFHSLSRLHHSNGNPVAILYHDTNFKDRQFQGGIINFNLLRPNGEYIGYSETLHISDLHGIHLRTGCFCNPGSCQRHLRLTTEDVKMHFAKGHVCGDQNDLIDGYPTGSVRISFGYMSTKDDADQFLTMIEECFAVKPIIKKMPKNYEATPYRFHKKIMIPTENRNIKFTPIQTEIVSKETIKYGDTKIVDIVSKHIIKNSFTNSMDVNQCRETFGVLETILIYPIKSCAAFSVTDSWDVVSTGLKYDREWMVVNHSGVCLTQKRDTNLCLLRPSIDIKRDVLELSFKDMPIITVPLTLASKDIREIFPCQSKVCNDRVLAWDCGDTVAKWLSEALNKSGLRLLRQCCDIIESRVKSKNGEVLPLSLANEAQFLLVNKSSIEWLLNRIPKNEFDDTIDDLIKRFRPNLVVNFKKPFLEKELVQLRLGEMNLKYSGQCTRCQMICIDQNTGEKSVEPLRTLSKEFSGKISFGIYLTQDVVNTQNTVALGSFVVGKQKSVIVE